MQKDLHNTKPHSGMPAKYQIALSRHQRQWVWHFSCWNKLLMALHMYTCVYFCHQTASSFPWWPRCCWFLGDARCPHQLLLFEKSNKYERTAQLQWNFNFCSILYKSTRNLRCVNWYALGHNFYLSVTKLPQPYPHGFGQDSPPPPASKSVHVNMFTHPKHRETDILTPEASNSTHCAWSGSGSCSCCELGSGWAEDCFTGLTTLLQAPSLTMYLSLSAAGLRKNCTGDVIAGDLHKWLPLKFSSFVRGCIWRKKYICNESNGIVSRVICPSSKKCFLLFLLFEVICSDETTEKRKLCCSTKQFPDQD